MRIENIEVNGLFGRFRYNLELKNDELSIIHGENGSGKTSILRIIDAVFNLKLYEILSIDFSHFSLRFNNGSLLKIFKNEKEEQALFELKKKEEPFVILAFDNYEPLKIKYDSIVSEGDFPHAMVEKYIPDLVRVGPRRWQYLPTREMLRLEEVVRRFSNELPSVGQTVLRDDPEWYQKLRSSIKVKFISTKRLYSQSFNFDDFREQDGSAMLPSVNEYSSQIVEIMQKYNNDYATISQSLDRNVWRRIIELSNTFKSINDVNNDLEKLKDRYEKLIKAGIFDENQGYEHLQMLPENTDIFKLSAVDMYNQDSFKKLDVFQELLIKLEKFKEILQPKFKNYLITINKQDGIVFKSVNNNKIIKPSNLSSGEQHEFILIFELLFKTEPNSLILIDEPEISLHVNWQESFLEDLLSLSQASKFNSLVATHSPYIIYDKHDFLVELNNL